MKLAEIIKLSKIDSNNIEVNLSEIVVYQNNNSNNEIISKIIKEIENPLSFSNAALKLAFQVHPLRKVNWAG